MGARTSKIYLKNVKKWVDAEDNERKAYNRVSEAARKRGQRRRTCACPKDKRWLCDADCPSCQFSRAGLFLSMDSFLGGDDDVTSLETVMPGEMPDAEKLLADKEAFDMAMRRLSELDSEWETIMDLRLDGASIIDIANKLGRNRRTLNSQMERYGRMAKAIFSGEI